MSADYPDPDFDTKQLHRGFNDKRSALFKDIHRYVPRDNIAARAELIYLKMSDGGMRAQSGSKRHKTKMFYCCYLAHRELGVLVDVEDLAARFQISRNSVQSCLHTFSTLQTGYQPSGTEISVLSYLELYGADLNLSEDAVAELIEITSALLEREPSLYYRPPQTLAAGLLQYYCQLTGLVLEEPTLISQITRRSQSTVVNIAQEIARLENGED